MPQHRGLETAETEIQIALQFGCVAIGVGETGRWQRDGAVVAGFRQPIDDRTAGISETEELGNLVVRLPRCIVPRPAEQLVMPGTLHEIEAGVSARYDQDHG